MAHTRLLNPDWPAGPLTTTGGMVDLPLAIQHSQCGIGTSEAPVFFEG